MDPVDPADPVTCSKNAFFAVIYNTLAPARSQKPNPSFFDACGRSRDAAAGILTAKTVEFFSVSKKLGPRSQNLGQEGQKSKNPKIQKSKNPKIQDFGPKSMKFGFDRLCQGPKINFLPFGTPKNPQTPQNQNKSTKNPDFEDFCRVLKGLGVF